jgi:Uri superfamily endonuclease
MSLIRCNNRPFLPRVLALDTESRRPPRLQSTPGTYALILSTAADELLQIGRLGQLHVRGGFYVYIGSAFGPGGVRARIAHHCRRAARPHWHIDFLRVVARLTAIWYTYDTLRREHQWAEVLQRTPGASIPLQRFGASDCTCASHLYFLSTRPACYALRSGIRNAYHDHLPIHCQRLAP